MCTYWFYFDQHGFQNAVLITPPTYAQWLIKNNRCLYLLPPSDKLVTKITYVPYFITNLFFRCHHETLMGYDIPRHIKYLSIYFVVTAPIDYLPIRLKSLEIFWPDDEDKLTVESLPLGLESMTFRVNGNNNLLFVREFLDNALIDNVSGKIVKFTIKGYQSIRRIQLRLKFRLTLVKMVIELIQSATKKWVWKPICYDGKIGIRPRVDMENFGSA